MAPWQAYVDVRADIYRSSLGAFRKLYAIAI